MNRFFAQCTSAVVMCLTGLVSGALLMQTKRQKSLWHLSVGAIFAMSALLWLPSALRLCSAVITVPSLILGLIIGTFIKENKKGLSLPTTAVCTFCFACGITLVSGMLPLSSPFLLPIGLLLFLPLGALCRVRDIWFCLSSILAGILIYHFFSLPDAAGQGLMLSLSTGMLLQCLNLHPTVLCGWMCAVILVLL